MALFYWLHISVSPVNVINHYFEAVACLVQKKSQIESRQYIGKEPNVSNVFYTKKQVDWLF